MKFYCKKMPERCFVAFIYLFFCEITPYNFNAFYCKNLKISEELLQKLGFSFKVTGTRPVSQIQKTPLPSQKFVQCLLLTLIYVKLPNCASSF